MIGDQVEISVVDIKGDQVKLGINAPSSVKVYRREVYRAIQEENRAAARAAPRPCRPWTACCPRSPPESPLEPLSGSPPEAHSSHWVSASALKIGAELLGHGEEPAREQGVEVRPLLPVHRFQRPLVRVGLLVRAAHAQRVIDVGECDDARAERDEILAEPVRVAAAVPALVVAQGDLGGHRVGVGAEDVGAVGGVLLHHVPLPRLEGPGLVQDVVGGADLAHVVQRGHQADVRDELLVHLGRPRRPARSSASTWA